MKHRSLFLVLTTLMIFGLLVSACAPAATQPPAATAAPATEAD